MEQVNGNQIHEVEVEKPYMNETDIIYVVSRARPSLSRLGVDNFSFSDKNSAILFAAKWNGKALPNLAKAWKKESDPQVLKTINNESNISDS